MDRRTVLGLGALAALATRAHAEEAPSGDGLPGDPVEVLPLWPGTPPGGEGVSLTLQIVERALPSDPFHDRYATRIAQPVLFVFRPQKPDGSALLIVPGGSYRFVVLDIEGFETARRAAASGVTAFVLRYRLPGEGWANRADLPLQDAQRAMRLLRGRAAEFGLDPARIGAIGFSAGGHVVASLLTRDSDAVYAPVDALDAVRARPDFAGLVYPVISMLSPAAHSGSRFYLLGPNPGAAQLLAASPERHVPAGLPPTFLALAADDPVVDPLNSLQFFSALRAVHVPAELHVFEEGGHGFGIRLVEDKPAAAWPGLFLRWAARHGMVRGYSA